MTEHETGALPALPGEGTGMSTSEELFEQLAVAVMALERIDRGYDFGHRLAGDDCRRIARDALDSLDSIRGTK